MIKSINYKILTLLFLWLILIFAVNAKPAYITDFLSNFFNVMDLRSMSVFIKENTNSTITHDYFKGSLLTESINFAKTLGPIIVFFFSIFLIIYYSKTNSLILNSISIIFLTYIFFQLVGLLYSYFTDSLATGTHLWYEVFRSHFISFDFTNQESINDYVKNHNKEVILKSSLKDIYWTITILSTIVYFTSIKETLNEFLYKYLFYILFFIIFIFSLFIFYPIFIDFIFRYEDFYTSIFLGQTGFLNQTNPTSTGLSRMFLLSYIISLVFYIYEKERKILRIVSLIFLIIFSTLILSFQSRGNILGLIGINLVTILFINETFKKKLFYIFIVFIIPISINFSFYSYLLNYSGKDFKHHLIRKDLFKSNIDMWEEKGRIIKKKESGTELSEEDFAILTQDVSSGRFYDWKKLLIYSKKKPFFGYGPQADRYLISSTAANALIYATICGGYLSAICILLLYLLTIFKIYNLIFKHSIFKNKEKNYLKCSVLVLLFLLWRGIYESSFAVFSVDFLVFFTCFTMLDHEHKIMNKFKLNK